METESVDRVVSPSELEAAWNWSMTGGTVQGPKTILMSPECFLDLAQREPNDPRYQEWIEFADSCPAGHGIMMTAERISYFSTEE